MFYHLEGTISELQSQLAVVDCGGIGFAVNTTNTTLSRLQIGKKAKLYIYSNIREDAFDLYGFATLQEKKSFEMLLGVSGVGPKAALSILSASTPEALAMAILSGDEKAITVAPGIGKKIAQRVILELKDKLAKETQSLDFSGQTAVPSPVAGNKAADAGAALSVLGYAAPEIAVAIKGIDTENSTVEEIVRQALRKMVK